MGDGNNIVHSWVRLAGRLPFDFVCACPRGFEPDEATVGARWQLAISSLQPAWLLNSCSLSYSLQLCITARAAALVSASWDSHAQTRSSWQPAC